MNKFTNMLKALHSSTLVFHTTIWFLISIGSGVVMEAFILSSKGQVLAMSTLAAFGFAAQVGKVLSVFLDDLTLKVMGKVMVGLSAMSTLALVTSLYDQEIFVYVISTIGVLSTMCGSVFGIRYDQVVRLEKKVNFEDIQRLEKFAFATSGLLIGLVTIGLYQLSSNLVAMVGITVSLVSTLYSVWCYTKLWSKYDTNL